MVTAGLVTWNMLNTNKQVQLDPFPRVLYNSILLCPDSGGCLVEAGHGCTQVIAPVAPGHQQNLSQCRWPSVTAAKTSCESWGIYPQGCGGFWCEPHEGACWARSWDSPLREANGTGTTVYLRSPPPPPLPCVDHPTSQACRGCTTEAECNPFTHEPWPTCAWDNGHCVQVYLCVCVLI